jgi:hypothetical protein
MVASGTQRLTGEHGDSFENGGRPAPDSEMAHKRRRRSRRGDRVRNSEIGSDRLRVSREVSGLGQCEEGDLNPAQAPETHAFLGPLSPVKPREPPSVVPGGDTARAAGKKLS